LFFIVVVAAYYLMPHRFRWFFLLAASCYFYMAFVPVYILILFSTIIVDYTAGIMIEKTEGSARKLWLAFSVIITILILAVFKYYNFLVENLNTLGFWTGYPIGLKELSILLPIGLSFHTFQSLSYVMEIYYGRQKAERNFGIYSLYVMFFPQLVAGPIERPQNLLGQFREVHIIDWDRIGSGLRLMLMGFFKKLVIADRLASVADPVFNDPQGFGTVGVAIAAVCFSFQIYCDFSGYTDIARGTARILGFELMRNFNMPYLAASISDFWRRWHISLSTWFKDYLYFPLGGSRVSVPKVCRNLMIVFVVSGIWHGASWNFAVWGALHGLLMVAGLLFATYLPTTIKLPQFIRVAFTFAIVTFAWIFFRSPNWKFSVWFVKEFGRLTPMKPFITAGDTKYQLALAFLSMASVLVVEYLYAKPSTNISKPFIFGRWFTYYAVLMLILLFGKFYSNTQFIYFQF